MPTSAWIVLVLALQQGGWLLFDGLHAFVKGDYVTPSTGRYAGELGPWSKLFVAMGVEPRGFGVKALHVTLGAVWLGAMIAYLLPLAFGWWAMLGCAIAGLWYLPFGTLLSAIQIVLLLLPAGRAWPPAV